MAQRETGVLQTSGDRSAISQRASRYIQLRAFEDPTTHLRWTLLKDTEHPAGPRRLAPSAQIGSARAAAIRRGDRVIVTLHTPVAEGLLEATALHDAAPDDVLRVRLKSNARILSVIVDGPGCARMQPEGEQR